MLISALLAGLFWLLSVNSAHAYDAISTGSGGHIQMENTIISGSDGVTINGKSYDIPEGGSLSVDSRGVLVNGKPVEPIDESKPRPVLMVVIKGNVQIVKDVHSVTVEGDAGNVATTNGDVTIAKSVTGAVTSVNGNIAADSIAGPVSTVNGNIDPRFKK